MNGFFNLYKPVGMTSAQAVAKVKKFIREALQEEKIKVGHFGTLDPLAQGVLPIGIGSANKLFDLLLNKTKTYKAKFKFGSQTDTLDNAGKVIKEGGSVPSKQEIENIAKTFIGTYQQVPPDYSAKSIDGRRAYDLARSGQALVLKPKEVTINRFELINQSDSDEFEFLIDCSSGTYVRALGRDLASKLSTYSTTTCIVRTRSGVFNLENSVLPENLSLEKLLPLETVLEEFEVIKIAQEDLNKILNGIKIKINCKSGIYKLYHEETILGLLEVGDDAAARIKIRF